MLMAVVSYLSEQFLPGFNSEYMDFFEQCYRLLSNFFANMLT